LDHTRFGKGKNFQGIAVLAAQTTFFVALSNPRELIRNGLLSVGWGSLASPMLECHAKLSV
jgi:hypothetical protein